MAVHTLGTDALEEVVVVEFALPDVDGQGRVKITDESFLQGCYVTRSSDSQAIAMECHHTVRLAGMVKNTKNKKNKMQAKQINLTLAQDRLPIHKTPSVCHRSQIRLCKDDRVLPQIDPEMAFYPEETLQLHHKQSFKMSSPFMYKKLFD